MSIAASLFRFPKAAAGVEPGLYHYRRESGGTHTRFHLRVDSDGTGVLLANATAAARLRPSGVLIAKGLLDGESEPAIVARLGRCFRGVRAEQAAADVARVREVIATLDSPGDNYPILNLLDPAGAPDRRLPEIPLSADMPLGAPSATEPILRRLWDVGIAHATILVGPEPNENDAVRAIELAEDLGLIAGARGRGTDLAGGSLVPRMVEAGLDHLDVLLLSAEPEIHDALTAPGDHEQALRALRAARDGEVCPVGTLVLVRQTVETIEETIDALVASGVKNVGFFAVATNNPDEAAGGALGADELFQAARLVEEAADAHNVRLLWYPPVRYDPGRPPAEQIAAGPRAAGDHAVRVEPDGSVIPARGPYRAAGNLLADDWATIRGGAVWREYVGLVETAEHCGECPGLVCPPIDCPRNPARWAEPEPLAALHEERR